MKCRGKNTRRELVRKYELVQLAHVKLLNGQRKRSCTGDDLIDRYFCFSYKSPSGKETGTLLCGSYAGKHFCTLLGIEPKPLFNPLRQEGNSSSASADKEISSVMKWNVVAKQLYDAIQLLVVCWNTVPGKVLAKIMAEIEQRSDEEPSLQQIKAVNKIISYDNKGRSLRRMLGELSNKNNLRDFSFDLLNAVLQEDDVGVESHFG